MAGRGLFDGLSWAMNTEPAVMQASGYVRTRDGVKHSPSKGSEKLAENLAVLSSTANTLTNMGMMGAVPALVSEAGATAGSFVGNEAGKYIVENNYVSEDVKPWVVPGLTILGGFLGGAASGMAVTKGAGVLKTQKAATATKTAKPEYSNYGGEFIDDVTVNSRQKYSPRESTLSADELAGLPKHERTNVRTSPKLDPEKAFEVRLGQKMAQEFTDPGVKEVVRNNPSAGMIMKNWMDDGMSEINAFKKYLAERRSVTRVVGVPASSVEEGVWKLNHSGEKMAREFKPINKTMNGANSTIDEGGVLYTAEYFESGSNYGAPEFVLKQNRDLTRYDLNDYIPASNIPKYIVKREYIMRPKMDFSGNTSTWLKNNPPLNAEVPPIIRRFYSKYKNILDDVSAETNYDYGWRLHHYKDIPMNRSGEIVFSGNPGELLPMKPVRHRDAFHTLIYPPLESVNTKRVNALYSWPELPVGNTPPWYEHNLKTVPYNYKQGGQIKPNFIKRLEDPNRKTILDWESKPTWRNNYTYDISTHKMGYEYYPDDSGRAIVYPEVQEINGKLVDFTRPPYHSWAGYDSALDRGDYLMMKDLEEARRWIETYKDRYKNLK